jgi:hypothetical protein
LLGALLAVALAPSLAKAQDPPPLWRNPLVIVSGADLTLYEATENMRWLGRTLLSGTPSAKFRKATSELTGVARRGSPLCPGTGTTPCVVNATGTSDVNLTTGMGNIVGTVTVVVQGDNAVDSPELVTVKGKFVGIIDFTPALSTLQPLPVGTVSALLVVDGGGVFPFRGTFRQPVDGGAGPVYFTGSGFEPVKANEFALGFPTVRFEITFEQPAHQ